MFVAVLLGLLALVGVGAIVVAVVSKNSRAASAATAVGCFILAGIVAAFSCFYSQDPGQAKVLRSFTGEVVGTDTDEGLGFKVPWVSLVNYDIRNQVVEYTGDGQDVTGPAITAQDKDGATATIDLVVRYSINPAFVDTIYRQYGSQRNFELRLVQNDVRAVVRNIPLGYATSEFRLKREEAASNMQDALAARWEKAGLLVDSVDLRDIRYPENIENSLRDVQTEINNVNKAEAELRRARVEADRTRVEAQAQADYDQIVRCGAKTELVEEETDGRKRMVTKVIPLPNDQCQNRLNEQVLTNKYFEALKEIAGKPGNVIVIPEGSSPMIQLPSGHHVPAPAPAG